MIGKVSQLYQTLLNPILSPILNKAPQSQLTAPSLSNAIQGKNIISGSGVLTYLINENSFYGIIGDNNTKYLPFNSGEFTDMLKNQRRVKYYLHVYPSISNIHTWGITSRIIALEKIE